MKNTNIYNLLIVEDNIIQSHEMANYISEKFENVKIYSMAATGKEAINIINKNIVDIILLDSLVLLLASFQFF